MGEARAISYQLIDCRTQRVLAEFPVSVFRTASGARHAASIQALRHAAGGTPVILTGVGRPVLYLPPDHEEVPAGTPVPDCRVRRAGSRRHADQTREQLVLPLDSESV